MVFKYQRAPIIKLPFLFSLIFSTLFCYHLLLSSLSPTTLVILNNHLSFLSLFNASQFINIPGQLIVNTPISSISIINLPRRVDRRIDSIGLMQKLYLQASIVPAYSISSPEIVQLANHRSSLTSTELACWASHVRLWMTLHRHHYDRSLRTNDSSVKWMMILEDDIDVEADLVQRLRSFPSSIWSMADLIYLGHCANPPGRLVYRSIRYDYRIHHALHPTCTHAYLIRSTSLYKLISSLSRPVKPLDESIVDLVHRNSVVVLSVHPPMAEQKVVDESNPSDVNLIDRRSLWYRLSYGVYCLLQWWTGVEKDVGLLRPTLKHVNRQRANGWRKEHEHSIWIRPSE